MFHTKGKVYTFGIAVLICAALAFLGCEEASSSSSPAKPVAPNVAAVPTNGQIMLIWQRVPGATSYKVFQGTNDNEVRNITEGNIAVITGLTNDIAYKFWVAAVNSGGSTLSAEVTAIPQDSVLAAPARVTVVVGDSQAVFRWNASTYAGVIGYKISTTGGIPDVEVSGRETTTGTVSNLSNGTEYSFTIKAVTKSIEGPPSTPITATPIAAPVVTATAADRQVTLSWTAVPGAVKYRVYQETNINEIRTTIITTSVVINELTNGQAYTFWVSAVNSIDNSIQSAAVTETPAAPTIAPTGVPTLTAVAGANEVMLSWTGVADASWYRVYQNGGVLSPDIRGSTSHTVTGLTSGTSHSFTVSAVNNFGQGAQSAAAEATPMPPVPENFSTAGGTGEVILSWTASADTAVTGYKIRTTGNGEIIADVDVTGRTMTTGRVTGLTAGVEYSFTIAAVAGSTESAQSKAVTGRPNVVQNVRVVITENAAGTAGSRQQVVLSWNTVAGASSYKVYQDSSEIAGSVTGTTHTVSGLTDGQSYSFKVSAITSIGETTVTEVVTCNFTDADVDGLIEICTLDHLAQINTDSTTRRGDYELVRNLDFSSQYSYAPGSDNWTNKIWRPVNAGTPTSSSTVVAHGSAVNDGWAPYNFTGSFNGRGYRIDNLYVRNSYPGGLFAIIDTSGVVRNLHVRADIYGRTSGDIIGIIAGNNKGLIIASSSEGTLDGLITDLEYIGGLVGQNSGTIAASYSTAKANGGDGKIDFVGGLLADNSGTVVASYATGIADGGIGTQDIVGGLVGRGWSSGSVIASYATGAVINASSRDGGNLVGKNIGNTITESYGYGTVNGSGGNAGGEKALTAGATGDGGAGNTWKPEVWDFGTSSQSPRLKWVTGYNSRNNTFSCNAVLLPAGQSCGGIIPGQPARE